MFMIKQKVQAQGRSNESVSRGICQRGDYRIMGAIRKVCWDGRARILISVIRSNRRRVWVRWGSSNRHFLVDSLGFRECFFALFDLLTESMNYEYQNIIKTSRTRQNPCHIPQSRLEGKLDNQWMCFCNHSLQQCSVRWWPHSDSSYKAWGLHVRSFSCLQHTPPVNH